jgi:hypothetical protein
MTPPNQTNQTNQANQANQTNQTAHHAWLWGPDPSTGRD